MISVFQLCYKYLLIKSLVEHGVDLGYLKLYLQFLIFLNFLPPLLTTKSAVALAHNYDNYILCRGRNQSCKVTLFSVDFKPR